MLEIWGSGLVVLAFITLDLPVVMLLNCLSRKGSDCRYRGSCKQSLDCKLQRYDLISLKRCSKPDPDNTDFAVCDEWQNCYREVDFCDGVADCIDRQDEKHCCPEGTYKCDVVVTEAKKCHTHMEKCNKLHTCWKGTNVTDCQDCYWAANSCHFTAKCYHSSHSCDRVNFCADGTDEKNCSASSTSTLGYLGKWLIIAVVVVAAGCSLGGFAYKKLASSTNSPSPSPSLTHIPAVEEAVEMPAADPFIFRSSHSYGGHPVDGAHTPGSSHSPSRQIGDSFTADDGSQTELLSNQQYIWEVPPGTPVQRDPPGQSRGDFVLPLAPLLPTEQPSASPAPPYPSWSSVAHPSHPDADLPPSYDVLFPQREQNDV